MAKAEALGWLSVHSFSSHSVLRVFELGDGSQTEAEISAFLVNSWSQPYVRSLATAGPVEGM